MDYFTPQLAREPLPVQFLGYKCNFLWPLSEQASWLQNGLQAIGIAISLAAYVGTLIGEFTFLRENSANIPALADCLTTTFMGIQYFARICILASRQKRMRNMLQRFYKEIYFSALDDAKMHREIQTATRFFDVFTKMYCIPMVIILVMFGYDIFRHDLASNDKPYIYRMSFRWYDAQATLPYIITCFYTSWLDFSCVSLMCSEDFVLCAVLCHSSYRFKELRQVLHNMLSDTLAEATTAENLHQVFRRRLCRAFKRQQQLYSFIDEAKDYFSYQSFISIFFGVLGLCVVLFQFQSSSVGIIWFKYINWLVSQTAQIIMIGYFGQMLMDETSAMQNSYYMCQWEDLLPYGTERLNLVLMGDIKFAILNAQAPVQFDGLTLLPLTHSTVGGALRSAMSYFMFLNTMNDAS